ncbi:toll/interleukin-1 receptor domain-containing protein [Panacibacter ginsenosidivorans]|uniref:Toll/interleukin-1 receptor domain-containing protein n=1 Tax=Panacibacter ginsenosidivorans TaxID=1813871 RepID=A0A5B8VER4_9BACT|nr:toll/interleukin-1 receptor domain-containing protein [Panacibacter ginsenosidivorans]QEC69555.1 toll/interleukin-1 receptor domain-containing protein [Panacibacter ginsenosidivorans]
MILLSQITIARENADTSIQLLQGDLTAIPKEHTADILVISAYPNDYSTADPQTLMSALYNNGIVVADLAKDKEIDLLANLNCWLSKPLLPQQQAQFNFKRILCFEPPAGDEKEKLVPNIFRCINTFAYDKQNNVIAMPVLASGNQRVPMEKMLPAILDAALFWLESGLPLNCIKLVLRNDEQVATALPIFIKAKQQYELKRSAQEGNISATDAWKMFEIKNQTQVPGTATMVIVENEMKELAAKESPVAPAAPMPQPFPAAEPATKAPQQQDQKKGYDFFISYSHKQATEVQLFVQAMLEKQPQLNIFYDKTTIPTGGLWIKLISDAIQNSKSVICILSPQYSASDVCWDEFQCAKAKEYRTKQPVIKTINFYNDANMPLIMSIYSYIDCTEGDIQKLKDSIHDLI